MKENMEWLERLPEKVLGFDMAIMWEFDKPERTHTYSPQKLMRKNS